MTISKGFTRRAMLATALATTAGAALPRLAWAADAKLPRTMVWTSYDLGSTGYVEASAMAEALDKTYGTTVRLTPSGTGVGRMLPLSRGRAPFGLLGNEILFAGDATYEFAARDWGPQDVRVLLGRENAVGVVAGGDTDIETPAALKGRKVGVVQASPSTTMNTEAVLAFADLTFKDVEQVIYPSYGAMLQGFIAGEIDAVPVTPTTSALREAEGGRGIRWLDMPGDDTAGWERVNTVASIFAPADATLGAGVSEDKPARLLGYRYPQIATYAETDEDEVYNLVKALDETFEQYQNANKEMPRWKVEQAGTTPAGAPFHPGAIRYLREKGIWTDKDEAWNEARLAHIEQVKAAWAEATKAADAEGVKDADWPAYWDKVRAEKALN